MRKKNISLLLTLILVILALLYFLVFKSEIKPINVAQISAESVKSSVASAPKNPLDLKVTAKTNEEAELLASDLYHELFAMVTLENGLMDEVEEGKSIDVSNFFDANEPASQFVPLYANNKVVGIVIFREFTKGEKELARVSQVNEDWNYYPPVSLYDADAEIVKNYPTMYYTPIDGYFFVEDRKTPYYLFEGDDGQSSQYYLVNAYDKSIVVKKDRKLPKSDDEDLPVKFSEDGLIELDDAALANSNLTDEDLEELKLEIISINKDIKEGTVKLDENMHVIYDNRDEEDKISSSKEGEGNQYSGEDFYDDRKMDNAAKYAPLID
ncbi:MAG: hypothetical protein ACPG3V_02265 [Porticoccaceae bacterium]